MEKILLQSNSIWDMKFIDDKIYVVGGPILYILSLDLSVAKAYQVRDDLYSITANEKGHIILAGASQYLHYIYGDQKHSFPLFGSPVYSLFYYKSFTVGCTAAPEQSIRVIYYNFAVCIIPRAHEGCADVACSGNEIISVGIDGQVRIWEYEFDDSLRSIQRYMQQQKIVQFDQRQALEYQNQHLQLLYKPTRIFKFLYTFDTVYQYNGVICAHAPSFGLIFIYRDARLSYQSKLVFFHNTATIIGICLTDRNKYWYRSRGSQYSVAVGGNGQAWLCNFPSSESLLKCKNDLELVEAFQLYEAPLPIATYRCALPFSGGILAAGVTKNQSIILKTPKMNQRKIEFSNPIDDVFWSDKQVEYIKGDHALSILPANGVSPLSD